MYIGTCKDLYSLPRRPDRLWGPPSLISNGYRGLSPRGQSGRSVKLTIHLYLVHERSSVPQFDKCEGALTPSSNVPPLTGLLVYSHKAGFLVLTLLVPGPFAKFVDSPYYSESELCGGTVTASFSKYLSWQSMHFVQRSTHFSKTCCRPLITSKFLASELPFHGWKSPEIAWGEIWTVWRMF
jgi:hypothetical protein